MPDTNKDKTSQPLPRGPGYPHYSSPGYPGYGQPYYGEMYGEEEGFLGNLSPLRILQVALRKWHTIALLTIIALALAYGYLYLATPIYKASAVIEMTVRPPRIMDNTAPMADEGRSARTEEVFNTRLEKFRSKDFRVFATPYFHDMLDEAGVKIPRESLAEDADPAKWIPKAEFELVRDTYLVKISIEHAHPTLARIAANAYAAAARANAVEENRDVSDTAVAWLVKQAEKQEAALEKAEEKLAEFRAEHNISVLENQRVATDNGLVSLNEKLTQLQSRAIQLREIDRFFSGKELTPELAAQLPKDAPGREEISTEIAEFQRVGEERESLKKRYTDRHPKLLELQERMEFIETSLKNDLARMKARSANNLALANNQIDQLESQIDAQTKQAVHLDQQLANLNARQTGFERSRDAKDTAYRGILARIQEARVSADENTATVKISSRADTPTRPIAPKPILIWAMALLLGLGAGMGLALLVDTLEDKVSGILDVETKIGVPVLGVVPHAKQSERPELAQSALKDKFGHVAEAFAGIRAVISSPEYSQYSKSILVSSTAPEEGKTIIASNLAISSAMSGKRTLLIDFDLRRPRLRRIFDLDLDAGSLLQHLSEDEPKEFKKLPKSSGYPNLDLVCSRSDHKISPAEILGSQRVSQFIQWAEENYDRVILDSAPYGLVSDGAVLAGYCSSVIFVLRPNKSRRKAVQRAITRYNDLGAHTLGVVVNDVAPGRGLYGGSYYYYYDHKEYYKAYRNEGEES